MSDSEQEYAELVERIVREVLRRLEAAGVKVDGASQNGASPSALSESESCAAAQELVLAERLVTLERIQGRLSGVRRVVVPPRAIVTPAVRDELRDRKIELVKAHT